MPEARKEKEFMLKINLKTNKIMKLQIGMHVKIKDNVEDFKEDSGKEKKITRIIPEFQNKRAFCLDGDNGIWLIEDFVKCVEYPDQVME